MERLKVVTLNIWNRSGRWEQRLPLIRRELFALAPDIVGLQEVVGLAGQPTLADEIAQGSDYRVFNALSGDLAGGLHFGNAILSRHDFLETAHWPFSADSSEPRGIGFARVDAPCGAVPFFVTHLSWRFHEGPERMDQVTQLLARVDEQAPTREFPAIVVGDMNAEPDAREMRIVRGLEPLGERGVYFADCWDYLHRDNPTMGPGYTFSRANTEALRTREPSRRIDYIFVRGPDRQLRGEPLVARVVFSEATQGVFPSDHFGVYAEIQASSRAY
jgi:endonuclease/exonuclease/phosphatase family metal-dependent hydrolase